MSYLHTAKIGQSLLPKRDLCVLECEDLLPNSTFPRKSFCHSPALVAPLPSLLAPPFPLLLSTAGGGSLHYTGKEGERAELCVLCVERESANRM